MGLEVFTSRDKLAHTPQRRESCGSTILPDKAMETGGESTDYTVDYIFSPSDSLEFLCNYLSLELNRPYCVVSIGKSETLSGEGGLILTYLTELFTKVSDISISLSLYSSDKVSNYLPDTTVKARSLQEVLTLTSSADYFRSRRPIKDGIMVFSVYSSLNAGVQFIESQVNSRTIELLLMTVTNSESTSDYRIINKTRLFDSLKRIFCANSRFILLGNTTPTEPHYSTTDWILRLLSYAMNNRHRCYTYYLSLLTKHIELLEMKVQKKGEEQVSGMNLELTEVKRVNEELRKRVAQMGRGVDEEAKAREMQTEINDLKNLLMLRNTEISDLKSRIRDLETELENKTRGLTTQFHFLSGVSEDEILHLRDENKELKSKNTQLNVEIQALNRYVGKPKVSTRDIGTEFAFNLQICPNPGVFLPGKVHFPSSNTQESLLEQIRIYRSEIASLQLQHSISTPSSDLKQSRTLYNLLTECWIFTDHAVKSMQIIMEKERARMEMELTERNLKIAKLENQQISKIKVDELEQKEKEVKAMQAALIAKEGEVEKMKTDFKAEVKRLKKTFKQKLEGSAAQPDTGLVTELQNSLAQLQEEAQEQAALWSTEQQNWEQERMQLQEAISTLETQLASLKDLRKPLPPASKRK